MTFMDRYIPKIWVSISRRLDVGAEVYGHQPVAQHAEWAAPEPKHCCP